MAKYVNNKDFYNQLKDYRETRSKKAFENIGRSFLLIARNLLNKSNFINYTPDRKDEMISDATYYMCRYIDKFDLNRKNPFAYFTTVARNAFLQSINDYTKRDSMFTSIEYIDNCEVVDNSTL
jgi:DNA-directed RNA polymerase specialized sigma24 family protein